LKLRKRLNRKVGNTEYSKWEINIPSSTIIEAGWKEGTDLEAVVKNDRVVLRPKKTTG
jgi:bifunctional DNA-binding transcriptional regulator/antitoxin component of YhaV-PrlF toxin-antitoxin module